MATNTDEYDFIIIRGGTAEPVLATRLTEDPQVQILVLEAGEDHLEDPNVNVPALWPSLLGSDVDWDLATVPQDSLNGRIIGHPQGRILGGSSALNAQAFIAPSEAGIDLWKDLWNPGWDWKTMSPYYKRCHTLVIPPQHVYNHLGLGYLIEGKHLGDSGRIQASYTGTLEDSLGLRAILSHGGATGGFANPTSVNPATKERSYSASAYYAPVRNRNNLHLVTGFFVEKVTFKDETDPVVANGVRVRREGITFSFGARKEVILAAGTFNSSKLLELSGVGGVDLLQSKGIDVIIDNPGMGENLQDHPMTRISLEVKDK